MNDGDLFDRRKLRLPLAQRDRDLELTALQPLGGAGPVPDDLRAVAAPIRAARALGRPVILMMPCAS